MRRPAIFGLVFGLALCGSFRVSAQSAPHHDQSLEIIIERLAEDLFEETYPHTQTHSANAPITQTDDDIPDAWPDLPETLKQHFRSRAAQMLIGTTHGTSI